jgi:hypothetical protein
LTTYDDNAEEFERIGEPQVRQNLASGIYGERRKTHAEEWLRTKDRGRVSAAEELGKKHSAE